MYVDVLDDWFYDGKMRLERSSYFIFGNIKMVGFGNWRLRWEVCRGIGGEKIGEMDFDGCFLYIRESHSPDRNGILFCCGRSEAKAVTKKIQWIAGNSS